MKGRKEGETGRHGERKEGSKKGDERRMNKEGAKDG